MRTLPSKPHALKVDKGWFPKGPSRPREATGCRCQADRRGRCPLQKLGNWNQGGEGFALRKGNSDLDSRGNTCVNSRKETRQACELSAASLGFSLGLWCHTCMCHALEEWGVLSILSQVQDY